MTAIALDGSGSSDPENDALTYEWSIARAPGNAAERLENAESVAPNFFAIAPGEYEIQLTVTDRFNARSTDTVVITLTNTPPIARADGLSNGFVGKAIIFDATASDDLNGQPLTYGFEVISAPEASSLAGQIFTDVRPEIVFDTNGLFELRLTVSDGFASDTIDVGPINIEAFEIMRLSEPLEKITHDAIQNRLVSADKNELLITSLIDLSQKRVPLSWDINVIALSPDGNTAVIGHDRHVSFVDLGSFSVLQAVNVPVDVETAFMDDQGNGHFYGKEGVSSPIYSINKDNPTVLTGDNTYLRFDTILTHPSNDKAYGLTGDWTPENVVRIAIEDGRTDLDRYGAIRGRYNLCGQAVYGPEGRSLLTGCGVTLSLTDDPATDMEVLLDLGVEIVDVALSKVNESWILIDLMDTSLLREYNANTGEFIDDVILDNGNGIWFGTGVYTSDDNQDVWILAEQGVETAILRQYLKAAKVGDAAE